MDEIQEVVEAGRVEATAGRAWALATIVAVAGSTYRRPGARLVIRDDATWVGNLSGGCLEGEVLELGTRVMDDGRLRRETYDLTADEEAIWGWGLGCNGAMEVVVEAAADAGDGPAATHLDLLARGRTGERPFRLLAVIGPEDAPELGAHLLVDDDGTRHGDDLPDGVVAAAQDREATTILEVGGLEVFVERVVPAQRLVVCGAGHDAIPLVARAASLGWEVVVVDDRSSFLDADRFPGASEFVRCEPGDVASAVRLDERTAAVVMSHNFLRDADYYAALAPAGLAYLGMLGPGKRLVRLEDHLASEGIDLADVDRSVVHGPAGLDLGAEGPDEIALAIVAEVMAAVRGRGAGFLRERSGPIHDPAAARPRGLPAEAGRA